MLLNWRAGLIGGLVAGIIATAAQIMLWWAFTDHLPEIFFRDARLAAAIILGPEVLPPPATMSWKVMFVASLVHVLLSVIYGLALACMISKLAPRRALLAGCIFGVILYAVNMYIMTILYPWFSVARDWITIAAHIVYGASFSAIYKTSSPGS